MIWKSVTRLYIGFCVSVMGSAPLLADPAITAPSGTVGTPNNSVSVGANGLTANSYNIVLKLSLDQTEPSPSSFFEVGSSGSFSPEDGAWTGTIDVEYNPGPGLFPGRALLNEIVMGQFEQKDLKAFEWQGPNMP